MAMEKRGRGHYTEPESEGENEWLMTFADLSTLLLCFFVLLFSISSVDNKKFRSIMNEVRVSLGNVVPMTALKHEEVKEGGDAVLNLLAKQKTVATELEEIIKDEKLSSSTVVDMGDDGALLRIGGKVMFESGSDKINHRILSALDKIIIMAIKYPQYNIDIKGHTDNLPISDGKFSSNWELSALRATTVLRYLLESGLEAERLTATGYADTQPLVPNLTAENRARNRRVEFLFKKIERE
ncbi:MAG: flagellar motor protein MotB [Deltaproteobacteria bacterium]|nr:flagellar motor protein MotB [Candidatus Tharpella sp.]